MNIFDLIKSNFKWPTMRKLTLSDPIQIANCHIVPCAQIGGFGIELSWLFQFDIPGRTVSNNSRILPSSV